jgi:type I restriction enzyme S subunit
LPVSWRWVKLGEVATVISGQHILESDYNRFGHGIGYLTGPADFGATKPAITKWTETPKVLCEPMDVLVTVKGAGVGKINLSPDVPVAIGRQLMAVRGHHGSIDTLFLYSFLDTCFQYFRSSAMGATVPGLSREDLENLNTPLPPVSEQRRIAAVLREQMADVEKARVAAEAELKTINVLPAALLRRAFAGAL